MYFVLYDKNLNSFDGSYVLESWSRSQRAYDFDAMEIVGEMVAADITPFFAVAYNHLGKQLFSGLCGTPQIDDKTKKSKIVVKDFMTLFNSEIIIDMQAMTTVRQIFEQCAAKIDCGFNNILLDTSDLGGLTISNKSEMGSYKAYDVMSEQLLYYGLYITSNLDVNLKTINIRVARLGMQNSKKIRLKDFDINGIEKNIGEITRVTIYSDTFVKLNSYILDTNNKIHKEPTTATLIYPVKNKNFIAQDSTPEKIEQATYDALMELAKSRYQENINIEDKFNLLADVDFSYMLEVSTERGVYKTLPLGEIETNSSGKRIIKIGFRPQLLTQIL